MKAVIYARYSSENQTEASIEGQLRECMEFAERAEIDVVGNYIDRALTAKTDNRPEFQRMIKDSYKHAFDCIIVWKLDRFARNRYDSAHYKSLLKKNGVKVISAKEGKQRLIDGFINAIYVYDDKITFTFNYKDGTRTVMLSELSDGKNNSDLKCQGAPRKRTGNLPVLFLWCTIRNLIRIFSGKVASFLNIKHLRIFAFCGVWL